MQEPPTVSCNYFAFGALARIKAPVCLLYDTMIIMSCYNAKSCKAQVHIRTAECKRSSFNES